MSSGKMMTTLGERLANTIFTTSWIMTPSRYRYSSPNSTLTTTTSTSMTTTAAMGHGGNNVDNNKMNSSTPTIVTTSNSNSGDGDGNAQFEPLRCRIHSIEEEEEEEDEDNQEDGDKVCHYEDSTSNCNGETSVMAPSSCSNSGSDDSSDVIINLIHTMVSCGGIIFLSSAFYHCGYIAGTILLLATCYFSTMGLYLLFTLLSSEVAGAGGVAGWGGNDAAEQQDTLKSSSPLYHPIAEKDLINHYNTSTLSIPPPPASSECSNAPQQQQHKEVQLQQQQAWTWHNKTTTTTTSTLVLINSIIVLYSSCITITYFIIISNCIIHAIQYITTFIHLNNDVTHNLQLNNQNISFSVLHNNYYDANSDTIITNQSLWIIVILVLVAILPTHCYYYSPNQTTRTSTRITDTTINQQQQQEKKEKKAMRYNSITSLLCFLIYGIIIAILFHNNNNNDNNVILMNQQRGGENNLSSCSSSSSSSGPYGQRNLGFWTWWNDEASSVSSSSSFVDNNNVTGIITTNLTSATTTTTTTTTTTVNESSSDCISQSTSTPPSKSFMDIILSILQSLPIFILSFTCHSNSVLRVMTLVITMKKKKERATNEQRECFYPSRTADTTTATGIMTMSLKNTTNIIFITFGSTLIIYATIIVFVMMGTFFGYQQLQQEQMVFDGNILMGNNGVYFIHLESSGLEISTNTTDASITTPMSDTTITTTTAMILIILMRLFFSVMFLLSYPIHLDLARQCIMNLIHVVKQNHKDGRWRWCCCYWWARRKRIEDGDAIATLTKTRNDDYSHVVAQTHDEENHHHHHHEENESCAIIGSTNNLSFCKMNSSIPGGQSSGEDTVEEQRSRLMESENTNHTFCADLDLWNARVASNHFTNNKNNEHYICGDYDDNDKIDHNEEIQLRTIELAIEKNIFLCNCGTCIFLLVSFLISIIVVKSTTHFNLDIWFAVLGATGSTMISYILPGVLYIKFSPTNNQRCFKICAYLQVVVGCIVIPTALYAIVVHAVDST